jgi:hypothetical protein
MKLLNSIKKNLSNPINWIFISLLALRLISYSSKEPPPETEVANTWNELNNDCDNNLEKINSWLEDFNVCLSKGESREHLIKKLIEEESPDFLCSFAFLWEQVEAENGVTFESRVRTDSMVTIFSLYQYSAERGYSPAMARSAAIYDLLGDHQMAIHWEKRGIEAGDSLSMLQRGIRLVAGEEFDGITKRDLEEGWTLIAIAAEMGEKNAENALNYGFGCSKNIIQLGKVNAQEWKRQHPEMF